ncbi:MAG: hypothetical protein J6B48_07075 [Clostridia bacterium]|nr:hypothetical protein [Clostridia bacterium]
MNIKPGEQFDINKLKNPPLDCTVTYSWLWNVPVTRELIDKSIEEAKAAGVRSLYMISMPKDFRPETMRTYLEPEYLTPEFFELFNYATRKCIENGIMPWLYDEGGWPSGGACGRTVLEYPEALTTMLKSENIFIKKGEKFTPRNNHFALFNGKIRLPIDYVADRDVMLTEFYGGPDTDCPYYLDYTDRKMTDTFIGNTYEPFKKYFGDLFGEKIPLIFTDEPGIRRYMIPKNFFKKFTDRYGYDFRDYIYVLENGGVMAESDAELRARMHYGKLLGELFIDNTFKPISEWCEKNGICYSGHVLADNYPDGGIRGYYSLMNAMRNFHIPGIDVIWEQIRYPYGDRAPVDEEETARMPFYPRLASSAARQNGTNLALTESIGIYGDGITPDEIRYLTNYQIVRGINVISYYHLPINNTRYSALATRPNFRPEKPGFYNLGHINEYVSRLTYLARLGYAEGNTALYHPSDDYFGNPEICNAAVDSFRDLGVELEEENIAFDLIDDYGILEAVDTGDGLKLGDALYKHIAVPTCKYMPDEVKAKIAPYIGKGAPAYTFKNNKLRMMTRHLADGRLYFIFNEGEPTVTEAFDISGGKKVYRIDPANGDMYRDDTATANLLCGEVAVFLVTDKEYSTVTGIVEYEIEATDFAPISHKRFVITYDCLTAQYGDGSIMPDEKFSGEITYKGHYELPKAPKAGERYKIILDGFSLTAMVKIGNNKFSLGLSPMTKIIDGASFEQSGEIEITIANTSLNEIKAKEGLMNHLPRAERGPYLDRLAVIEERVPELKFGKVCICKLK